MVLGRDKEGEREQKLKKYFSIGKAVERKSEREIISSKVKAVERENRNRERFVDRQRAITLRKSKISRLSGCLFYFILFFLCKMLALTRTFSPMS